MLSILDQHQLVALERSWHLLYFINRIASPGAKSWWLSLTRGGSFKDLRFSFVLLINLNQHLSSTLRLTMTVAWHNQELLKILTGSRTTTCQPWGDHIWNMKIIVWDKRIYLGSWLLSAVPIRMVARPVRQTCWWMVYVWTCTCRACWCMRNCLG